MDRQKNNSWKYFKNEQCEYYPCHETDSEYFNCLFCYCPLYALGDNCGGDFEYTANSIKDCSKCSRPHLSDSFDKVIANKIFHIGELPHEAENK